MINESIFIKNKLQAMTVECPQYAGRKMYSRETRLALIFLLIMYKKHFHDDQTLSIFKKWKLHFLQKFGVI